MLTLNGKNYLIMDKETQSLIVQSEGKIQEWAKKLNLDITKPSEFAHGWRRCFEWLDSIQKLSPKPEQSNLREAAKEILHLHLCEQEGLSSGQPTPKMWIEAVDKLSEALASEGDGWVRVEDGLPELKEDRRSGPCQVELENGEIMNGCYIFGTMGWCDRLGFSQPGNIKIIRWRPQPL
jgi:hypothetical protein